MSTNSRLDHDIVRLNCWAIGISVPSLKSIVLSVLQLYVGQEIDIPTYRHTDRHVQSKIFRLFRENNLGQIYPAELEIKDTTENNTSASHLDLLLSVGRDGQLRTSLYDKRDDSTSISQTCRS